MHGVTFNNVIRITFLSSGQLFSLPEIPKLAFDAQNSSKQHIQFSYYFTESTLYPNYKERSNNAEYENSGCLSSQSKHNVWAKYSYLMLGRCDRCALGVSMLKAHDSAVSSPSLI
jgi:hypothetical protein